MPTYRHGALYVVESANDSNELPRALKVLDDRLFLERQVTLTNEVVWCVVLDMNPPMTVLEWRDEAGRPLDLSWGIVERMRRMVAQGDARKLGEEVARRNHEMIERKRQESRAASREIVEDMLPSVLGKRSVVLPRGVGLRRARDKRRARGEKL